MSHSEYQELLAAFALEAIDPRDAEALGEHIATCAECRAELSALREAAGLLAHAAPWHAPGEQVRARILSAVRADGRREPTNVTRIDQRPRRSLSPYWLRIAAVLALVALGVVFMRMWLTAQHEIANLTYQVESQRVEMNRQREARLRDQEVLAVLASRDAKTIQLAGTPTAKDASAMFVFDQKSRRAVLVTRGLPLTTADKAYELWFIPKGHSPMPGKVFTVDASGHAMIMEQVPTEAMTDAVFAITVEPKSGSNAPTGAIYLSSPAS